jgi:peptidoglycan pentaglycine glycine transferase (the first glycine)
VKSQVNLRIEELDCSADTELAAQWEELLKSSKYTGFMQSLSWAAFKRACGQKIIHLGIKRENELIGGTLITTAVDGKRPTVLVSPYGPVIPWDDSELAAECLRLLIERTRACAAELNAVSWRIEPRLPVPAPRILMEFAGAPLNMVPVETLIVDLRADDNTILERMKPKCRYNIRLAQRHGVLIKELEGEDSVNVLYAALDEASHRDDFFLESKEFFQNLVKSLHSGKALHVLAAEHEGECLGALVLVIEGKRSTYLYGGISNRKRQLMAGYLLQWESMKLARQLGCESYDFYGYDQFQSPGNAYARFSRFKSGFGGEVIRYIGAQDYVFMEKLVDNVIMFFKDAERSNSS